VRGLIEYVVATAVTFEDKVDLKSFKNNIMLRNPCSESGSEVNRGVVCILLAVLEGGLLEGGGCVRVE
jgi:hypothetical protein